MAKIDLDMLAYDLADMLDRYGYKLDAAESEIRPHLPAFIDAIRATVAARPDDDEEDEV